MSLRSPAASVCRGFNQQLKKTIDKLSMTDKVNRASDKC